MLYMLKKNWLISLFSILILSCCSYSFTSLKNPWEKKGVKTISVPVFENKTMEAGAEVYFTNSLRTYLLSRSGKLKLLNQNADARITGSLKSVTVTPASRIYGTTDTERSGGLANNRILAISYTLVAVVELKLIRNKDEKVLWSNSFSQSINMDSGSFTDERKSTNVFIKESKKQEGLRDLADQTMKLAVEYLLEEF